MEIFKELAILFLLSGVLAVVFSFFKIHSILAYVVVGVILGPLGVFNVSNSMVFKELSEIGVTLLLFMVGLELDLSQLKSIGKKAIIAGALQVVITSSLGFLLIRLLGYDPLPSLLIAIAITFSSTVLVVKLLSEKKELQSLHGKLVVSVFLVQDIIAIFLLVLIGSLSGDNMHAGAVILPIVLRLLKGLAVVLALYLISKIILPKFFQLIKHSDELMLVFSLAWVFGIAMICSSELVGMNLEVGGFIAGLSLASSSYHFQISARTKSLRDFFLIIFFMVLGLHLHVSNIISFVLPTSTLALFVLIINPLILMIVFRFLGYKSRTGFLAGITINQVSEFSLIIMAVALSKGLITRDVVSMVTLVTTVTLAVSPYGIMHSQRLYEFFKPYLKILEPKRKDRTHLILKKFSGHVVLVGAHRLGEKLLEHIKLDNSKLVIIDFNPDQVAHLVTKGYNAFYGDATDPEIQEFANMHTAKIVISTIPSLSDSLSLLSTIRQKALKTKVVLAAQSEGDAELLYHSGADYVLLPHTIGAKYLSQLLKKKMFTKSLAA